eukprot:CAMPEP_0115851372 /NCGR_PEP_ID=MMETSP0287-20121206/12448_1 /TAXON_ID=412157 /ORGANISM="Chrysochromulina rotalis, Strain UIO044" /LENGTH=371 /DNA_ID=CAMNT_0003305403 /DNA_START=17 /DNA_END=1132 /DNA_ORIENTATION=+
MRILVAMVSDSGTATRKRVSLGMEHVDSTFAQHQALVDWTICTYDDGANKWHHVRAHTAQLYHVRLVSVVNASVDRPLNPDERRARGVHRKRAVTAAWDAVALDAWDAIWLSDSDISFAEFDLGSFLRQRACADPGGVPLIVQPTLRQSTQCWPFNHNSYHVPNNTGSHLRGRWERWESILLLRLRWVESQSVLFDAAFLRWFYETPIVRNVLELQMRYHVSWGTDALWCGAALEYRANVHPSSRAACAVVTVPIGHDNTKSIGARGGEYINNGFRLLEDAGITHRACLAGGRVPSEKCAARVHKWWSPFANQVCAAKRPSHTEQMSRVLRCASTSLSCASAHSPATDSESGGTTAPAAPDHCDELQPLYD